MESFHWIHGWKLECSVQCFEFKLISQHKSEFKSLFYESWIYKLSAIKLHIYTLLPSMESAASITLVLTHPPFSITLAINFAVSQRMCGKRERKRGIKSWWWAIRCSQSANRKFSEQKWHKQKNVQIEFYHIFNYFSHSNNSVVNVKEIYQHTKREKAYANFCGSCML